MSKGDEPGAKRRMVVFTLLSMVAIYYFSFFQRVAVPGTIFDELQSSFSASASAVAGLAAVVLYLYGVLQPLTGVWADRYGAARVILIGAGLLSIGSLAFPFSPNLTFLYMSRLVAGVGMSLVYISMVKAISEFFDGPRFINVLGVALFLGYTGGLSATLPLERLVAATGWRVAMFVAGAGCSVAFLCAWVLLRKSARRGADCDTAAGGGSIAAVKVILREKSTWPLILTNFGNYAVYFLVQTTIGKKFLGDYAGIDSRTAALFTFLMMFVMMSCTLLGGFISEFIGNRRKPLILSGIIAVFCSMLLNLYMLRAGIKGHAFLASYLLLGCSLLSSAACNATLKEQSHPALTGTAIGIYNGAAYIAVAVVNNLAGLVLDRHKGAALHIDGVLQYPKVAYQEVFLFCAVLSGLAIVSALFVTETRGAQRSG